MKAWAGSKFNIKGLTEERLAQLKTSIPTSIRTRKIHGLSIRRSQLLQFVQLGEHVPHAKVIVIVAKDDDTPGQTMFSENDEECDRWYKTILISMNIVKLCDDIFFPREAFKKEIAKDIVEKSMMVTYARSTGAFDTGDIPNFIIMHKQIEDCPEAYVVSVFSDKVTPEEAKIFHVWSSGPPCKKLAEP